MEYLKYSHYRVITKGSDEYHDRRCPLLKAIDFHDRDYVGPDLLVDYKPCKLCGSVKFRLENSCAMDLLKRAKFDVQFEDMIAIFTKKDLTFIVKVSNNLEVYNFYRMNSNMLAFTGTIPRFIQWYKKFYKDRK